jgi:hypothetical protein
LQLKNIFLKWKIMDSNQNQSKLNKFLKSQWFLFIKDILIIILLVFLVKAFIAETFVVK